MCVTPVTDSAFSGPAVSGRAVSEQPRLEVRWIRQGAVDRRVLDWFALFPITTESRVDMYLSDPDIAGQSVKLRGGRTLEVKVHRGRRGELVVPGRARGVLESWQRWSFHTGAARWGETTPPGWTAVSKVRRVTFVHGNGTLSAGSAGPGREIGCAVELTDVSTAGQQWWTMSFEASGPESDLRGVLESAAVMVLTEPMPGGIEFRSHESYSYAAWLREQVAREEPSAPGAAPRLRRFEPHPRNR